MSRLTEKVLAEQNNFDIHVGVVGVVQEDLVPGYLQAIFEDFLQLESI